MMAPRNTAVSAEHDREAFALAPRNVARFDAELTLFGRVVDGERRLQLGKLCRRHRIGDPTDVCLDASFRQIRDLEESLALLR